MSYTRKQLEEDSLRMIKEANGEDLEFEVNGKKYILDMKAYEAQLRFDKPWLFKDKEDE